MTTEEYLSTIDALAVQPFPEVTYVDASGGGGPEHHVRDLQARLDDLATRLTDRWGSAFVVDLGPYLSASCEGAPSRSTTSANRP
ncbi:hypothetical protein ABZO31_00205 [Streptomyces sp. HUAS MG47]|uniref:hypothetical protein n=1 Tax=Streptomyces solicamelliae TaxID=3231716 RepID=UPI0038782F6A